MTDARDIIDEKNIDSDGNDDETAFDAALSGCLNAIQDEISDPHGDRMVGISIFANKTTTTPCINQLQKWRTVRRKLMRRTVRAEKNGLMIGGYTLAGERCDENVKTRSLVQLDIDTKTDKETGEIIKRAPPFDDIRGRIDKFEYIAASSHNHDPAQGLIKYRVTFVPDRNIKPDEHEPLLETLDEWLGGILDRDARAWSQAFYLPSCPPERAGDAFEIHNAGAALPVDIAVEHGRKIIAARQSIAGPSTGSGGQTGAASSVATPPRTPPPETQEEIARVVSMLDVVGADTDRTTWRNCCWAVMATGWDCAEKLIREWSERSTEGKFVEADFVKVVASFDPAGGIGFGTLFHHARQSGWQDPADTKAADVHDIRNGQRFAEANRNKLLWLADMADWLRFDPEIGWRPAPFGEADRAAMAIVAQMRAEAKTKQEKAEVKRASLSRNLDAMIKITKSMPGMSARLADFDNEPMVIGLQNGIFDLDKWKCEPPTPERKVSKRTNVAYDPGAKCPQFLKFLKEVQPDPKVRGFLRRFMGYCLTGRVDEHVLIYLHGDGRNGKGTFVELMAHVLGDYASKIPTEMLMAQQRNSQAASPDILLLKGLRFAFANETKEGKQLDEARIKDLTGGDTQTARGTYAKTFVQFKPTHKLAISGNYKAEVRDNSTGMWERMILVPFDVWIPEADRDQRLGDTLKAEAPGVLNWMLAGLKDYQTKGLKVPQVIKDATAAYRSEQDLIGEWITDKCVTVADLRENKRNLYAAKLQQAKGELYSDYSTWASTSGYKPVSKKRLTRQLGERGFKLGPDKRTINGIVLRAWRTGASIPDSALKDGAAGSADAQSPDTDDRKIVDFKKRASPDGAPDGGADQGGAAGPARPSDEV